MSPAFAMHPDAPRPPMVCAEPIVVRRTRSDSIEQHMQQLQDWNLHYDQLDGGRFEGHFTDIRLPGMQLFVETTTRCVRKRGELMPESCGIGTMMRGMGPLCVNGVQSGAGTLLAFNPTELDMCTPPDCTFAGLVVDARVLQMASEAMTGLGPQFRPDSLRAMVPPESSLAPWRQLLLDAVRAAVDRPEILNDAVARQRLRDDLLLTLIDAMADAFRDDPVRRTDNRKRIVDRACELMLSRPDEPPTLFEVCHRVGASPRKLGSCFQDVLGLSPGRYIKAIRLNAVRRELSCAEDPNLSVYDAAARSGFWHFGHFSADYKKFFAELPSETLRRARARHAA